MPFYGGGISSSTVIGSHDHHLQNQILQVAMHESLQVTQWSMARQIPLVLLQTSKNARKFLSTCCSSLYSSSQCSQTTLITAPASPQPLSHGSLLTLRFLRFFNDALVPNFNKIVERHSMWSATRRHLQLRTHKFARLSWTILRLRITAHPTITWWTQVSLQHVKMHTTSLFSPTIARSAKSFHCNDIYDYNFVHDLPLFPHNLHFTLLI